MRYVSIPLCLLCTLAILSSGCNRTEQPTPTTNRESADVKPSTTNEKNADVKPPTTNEKNADAKPPTIIKVSRETPVVDDDDGKLAVGSPAPELKIATWVKGEELEGFAEGQVYVVEFWATWCGPCLAGMPHLSKLQQEYGDKVRMVGVTAESEKVVREFLKEEQSEGKLWKDVIQYTLAADDHRATNRAYMRAAGQNGIPTAFVVGRDGVIEWIGHPARMDEPLEKVVANEWDRSAAIAEFKQKQQMQEIESKLGIAFASENWDAALEIIDKLSKETQATLRMSMIKLHILQQADRNQEAKKLLANIVKQQWDQVQVLNQIAWSIATGEMPGDLKLALKAAKRASELTDDNDAAILDTLARVHHAMGDLDAAITWQKKAVATDNNNPQIARALKRYESEKKEKEKKGKKEKGEKGDKEKDNGKESGEAKNSKPKGKSSDDSKADSP